MPELPEVEALRRAISPLTLGHVIHQAHFYRKNLRIPIPISDFQKLIVGNKISAVTRRSKYLLLETEAETIAIFHLGMSGYMESSASPQPIHKHTHATFEIREGGSSNSSPQHCYIHFVDPRRFGLITCCRAKDLQEHRFFKNLGPEPLDRSDLAVYLFQVSRNKKVSVKNFIMNASILVGVGNIYASESLYKAGIRPTRQAGFVSLRRYQKLADAIQSTLMAAIKAGGTTLRDFRKPSGEPGYFAVDLKVYGREGEKCSLCGSLIQQIRIGGRSSFFCARCQK